MSPCCSSVRSCSSSLLCPVHPRRTRHVQWPRNRWSRSSACKSKERTCPPRRRTASQRRARPTSRARQRCNARGAARPRTNTPQGCTHAEHTRPPHTSPTLRTGSRTLRSALDRRANSSRSRSRILRRSCRSPRCTRRRHSSKRCTLGRSRLRASTLLRTRRSGWDHSRCGRNRRSSLWSPRRTSLRTLPKNTRVPQRTPFHTRRSSRCLRLCSPRSRSPRFHRNRRSPERTRPSRTNQNHSARSRWRTSNGFRSRRSGSRPSR